ncbi:hypothetical protein FOZ60_010167 [Perkinsus olseni]|uniref:Uncharacterized protein n=1 Tax=Perkinsus olseni TaxID=32597 RepID=A0A7J6PC89_PEROL|nr:hypothetical protein FOZ60_010167 [Perkinsus olseni]
MFSSLSFLVLGGGGSTRRAPPPNGTTLPPSTTSSGGKSTSPPSGGKPFSPPSGGKPTIQPSGGKPPSLPSAMKPTVAPFGGHPTSPPSWGRYQMDYGDFVYRSKGAPQVTMILNVTKDGRGMFTIDCGRGTYRDGWFPLHEIGDNPYYDKLIKFPPGDVHHRAWLDNARAVCPGVHIPDWDLNEFNVNRNGNVETSLHDATQVLKRWWVPLDAGRYSSNYSTSNFRLHYQVQGNGFVQVLLGCPPGGGYRGGFTGWKPYRLVSQGPGMPYSLTPIRGHGSVRELLNAFEMVCPLWRGSFKLEDFEMVRFATPGIMYAFGQYPYDRLYRDPLS